MSAKRKSRKVNNTNSNFTISTFRVLIISRIISVILLIVGFCPIGFAEEESLSAPLPGSPGSITVGAKDTPSSLGTNPAHEPAALINNAISNSDNKGVIVSPNVFSEDLPVSVKGLIALIEKYKEQASYANLGEGSLNPLLDWINGLIKSHNKLAAAFYPQSNLKTNFENESCIARELHKIKDEVLYLKAQMLIKEKKLKEAIPMLIEIICSEPNSALGQTAYQHLKHCGFSPQSSSPITKPAPVLPAKAKKKR